MLNTGPVRGNLSDRSRYRRQPLQEHSGTIFGLLFTIALCGGMTASWLAGYLAEAAGIRAVFVLASANFDAIAVLGRFSNRRSASVEVGRGRASRHVPMNKPLTL